MINGKKGQLFGTILMLLYILSAHGCLIGTVMDTSGNAVPEVEVVAVANCSGAGCEAHQTEITVGSETHKATGQPPIVMDIFFMIRMRSVLRQKMP